jgi:hypothetical protein
MRMLQTASSSLWQIRLMSKKKWLGVSYEDGCAFAQQSDAPLMEVSAKIGVEITKMFDAVALWY